MEQDAQSPPNVRADRLERFCAVQPASLGSWAPVSTSGSIQDMSQGRFVFRKGTNVILTSRMGSYYTSVLISLLC